MGLRETSLRDVAGTGEMERRISMASICEHQKKWQRNNNARQADLDVSAGVKLVAVSNAGIVESNDSQRFGASDAEKWLVEEAGSRMCLEKADGLRAARPGKIVENASD